MGSRDCHCWRRHGGRGPGGQAGPGGHVGWPGRARQRPHAPQRRLRPAYFITQRPLAGVRESQRCGPAGRALLPVPAHRCLQPGWQRSLAVLGPRQRHERFRYFHRKPRPAVRPLAAPGAASQRHLLHPVCPGEYAGRQHPSAAGAGQRQDPQRPVDGGRRWRTFNPA